MSHPLVGFQAVILCGPGTSLYPFTAVDDLPKALIPVANKPMIHYPLEWCEKAGFDGILILTVKEHHTAIQSYIRSRTHKVKPPVDYYTVEAASSLEDSFGTADILRVAFRNGWLKMDFAVLPCDVVTNLEPKKVAELWMVTQAGFDADLGRRSRTARHASDGEDGRRAGLGIWYDAMGEGAVKGQETDFLIIAPSAASSAIGYGLPEGNVGTVLNTMPTQALKSINEMRIRRGMLKRFPDFKMHSTCRDSSIYFFPYWILKFIDRNSYLNSIREDVIPWIAKARWQHHRLSDSLGLTEILTGSGSGDGETASDEVISQVYDVASLSASQISRRKENGLELKYVEVPGITAYLPDPSSAFIRRVDTTHLYLFTSLYLAKTDPTVPSSVKIDSTASINTKAIVTAIDCLVAEKVSIAERAVVKKSVLGPGVSIGRGVRLTGCVLMDGASVAENAKLEGCIIGRRAIVGSKVILKDCEVAEGYIMEDGLEAKGERFVASMGLGEDSEDQNLDSDDVVSSGGTDEAFEGGIVSNSGATISAHDATSITASMATTAIHLERMRLALAEAKKCTPVPTAYCVGAILVDSLGNIISSGYSRELPGNTHAEQCCLEKILPSAPPDGSLLYTTMEPCSTRLSGNKTCVDRILEAGGIDEVFVGVKEPPTFVKKNVGEEKLQAANIKYVHVQGLEAEILQVSEKGHEKGRS